MDAPAARSATLISADLAPLALAQWWLTASGSLEPVSTAVAVDYLSHFFMISIMFHMTHVNFRVRMLGHVVSILTFCTLGWGGGWSGSVSFSERGQPFDTYLICVFNALGWIVGNSAELIVRRAFMATHREQKQNAALLAKLERKEATEVLRRPPPPPPVQKRKRRRV